MLGLGFRLEHSKRQDAGIYEENRLWGHMIVFIGVCVCVYSYIYIYILDVYRLY